MAEQSLVIHNEAGNTIHLTNCNVGGNINQVLESRKSIVLNKQLNYGMPLNVVQVIGREQDVYELSVAIRNERRVAITGVGGVGKTSLATYCAQKWSTDDTFFHIIFLNCETFDVFEKSVHGLAATFGMDNFENIPKKELFKTILDDVAAKKTLFIYDNVDDVHIIREYLPRNDFENVCFIATSQNNELKPYFTLYHLEMLTEDLAMELLKNKLNRSDLGLETAKKLADLFQGYPLGLIHSCAAINDKLDYFNRDANKVVFQYVKEYEKNFKIDPPESFEDPYRHSVYTAIRINLEKVLEKYKEKRNIYRLVDTIKNLVSFGNPDSISLNIMYNLVTKDVTRTEVDEVIRTFCKYSIFTKVAHDSTTEAEERVNIHRTVQFVCRSSVETKLIIPILCDLIHSLGEKYVRSQVLYIQLHVRRKGIFNCTKDEWRHVCKYLFNTPHVYGMVQLIIQELRREDSSGKEFLEILCDELANSGNINLYEYLKYSCGE